MLLIGYLWKSLKAVVEMLESDLVAHLKADDEIKTIFQNPDRDFRIYPKVAPQNVKSPYIVYHEIVGVNNQCLGGGIYQQVGRFQINIISSKYYETKEIRELVKSCLLDFKSSADISTRDDYDEGSKLFMEIIDFRIKD